MNLIMTVELSSHNLLLGVSFHSSDITGLVYCDYGGITGSGDTAQEAFDAAFREHARLCREEDDAHIKEGRNDG